EKPISCSKVEPELISVRIGISPTSEDLPVDIAWHALVLQIEARGRPAPELGEARLANGLWHFPHVRDLTRGDLGEKSRGRHRGVRRTADRGDGHETFALERVQHVGLAARAGVKGLGDAGVLEQLARLLADLDPRFVSGAIAPLRQDATGGLQ